VPRSCGSDQFDAMRGRTDSLVSFNSMVWKQKKDSGISLKSPIAGIDVPDELELFGGTLRSMHNLGVNE